MNLRVWTFMKDRDRGVRYVTYIDTKENAELARLMLKALFRLIDE